MNGNTPDQTDDEIAKDAALQHFGGVGNKRKYDSVSWQAGYLVGWRKNQLESEQAIERAKITEAKGIRKNIESLGPEVYMALERIDGHIAAMEAHLTTPNETGREA